MSSIRCGLLIALVAFTALAKTQNTTAKIFAANRYDAGGSWAASIVGACSDETTYALQCTAGIIHVPGFGSIAPTSTSCGSDSPKATITAGPSTFIEGYETMLGGISFSVFENCDLSGATEAICTETAVVSVDGTKTTSAASSVFTGDEFQHIDVAITAGAQKLLGTNDTVCTSGTTSLSISAALAGAVSVCFLGAALAL